MQKDIMCGALHGAAVGAFVLAVKIGGFVDLGDQPQLVMCIVAGSIVYRVFLREFIEGTFFPYTQDRIIKPPTEKKATIEEKRPEENMLENFRSDLGSYINGELTIDQVTDRWSGMLPKKEANNGQTEDKRESA